ncbi:MAG: hypothetical protein LIO90_04635 [Bacteroidales bacterium]|nr:hypothetical protein [Bacteroidales bacterium]
MALLTLDSCLLPLREALDSCLLPLREAHILRRRFPRLLASTRAAVLYEEGPAASRPSSADGFRQATL